VPNVVAREDEENLNQYGERLRALLDAGTIDLPSYFENVAREAAGQYVAAANPRAGSGHSSDERRWYSLRSMILGAIHTDGTFLDVGSANGHLIESLQAWNEASPFEVAFYGLEISPDLHALARERLPKMGDRLFCGNALTWTPPFRFEYVYTMIATDVPEAHRGHFLGRLLNEFLAPGGRLILGPWKVEEVERLVVESGYEVSGFIEKADPTTGYNARFIWVDKE
jgi:hypothetical protein